jgi:hypothetical protein
MNCPACGADNREGANFCRMCGATLAEPTPIEILDKAEQGKPVLGESEALAESVPEDDLISAPEDVGDSSEKLVLEAEIDEKAVEEAGDFESLKSSSRKDLVAQEPARAVKVQEEPLAQGTGTIVPAGIPELESEVPVLGRVEEPTLSEVEGSDASGAERVAQSAVERTESLPAAVGVGAADDQDSEENGERDGETIGDDIIPEFGQLEPLVPIVSGAVIEGRFEVVSVLDQGEDEILYLANDLRRCWQCDFEDNDPDGAYCAQCGVSLDRPVQVRLLEERSASAQASSVEAVFAHLSQDRRHFLLLAESVPSTSTESGPQVEPAAPQPIRLVVGQRSDVGQVRELDEDSLLALTLAPTYDSRTAPVLGLFAVADGMGGHEGGEIASKLALQVLAGDLMRDIVLPELAEDHLADEEILARMRQATANANDAVYLARQKRGNDMGTTLTTVLVRDDQLFLAHVGDCRAYRWNASGLLQLTTDH